MLQPPPAPPGWYTDPNGSDTRRFWDGTAWTNRPSPMPVRRSAERMMVQRRPRPGGLTGFSVERRPRPAGRHSMDTVARCPRAVGAA